MRKRHTARTRTPYGENPDAIRRDSERHARARRDTFAHRNAGHTAETPSTGPTGVRAIARQPPCRDPARAQARHIHATKCPRTCSRNDSSTLSGPSSSYAPARRPDVGMVTLYGPHAGLVELLRSEFSIITGSTTLRGPRRPDGPLRPGLKPTHQLCDHFVGYRFRTRALCCSHWFVF